MATETSASTTDLQPDATASRRSIAFILFVALANAGGVVAYLPLLTLLLPVKIETMTGEARLDLLTAVAISGAVAASAANILFGWLSDRSVQRGGGRRGWATAGLIVTALGFAVVAFAQTPAAILVAVVLFQVALNALLAPLFAIMAEEVPDAQKGLAGGLLALGNPMGAAVSAVLVGIDVHDIATGLLLTWIVVALSVAPLLRISARPAADVPGMTSDARMSSRDLAIAWAARLCVQVAGCVLSLYLLYYFESIEPATPPGEMAVLTGRLMPLAYLAPLPFAVMAGRWSDRSGRRKPFFLAAAVVTSIGLVGMAVADRWIVGAAGFVVCSIGWLVFLSLHTGYAMQLLPDPRHRGRDLGMLNLANTLPSLLGPLLAWLLAIPRDFDTLLMTLAALSLAGAGLMTLVRSQR